MLCFYLRLTYWLGSCNWAREQFRFAAFRNASQYRTSCLVIALQLLVHRERKTIAMTGKVFQHRHLGLYTKRGYNTNMRQSVAYNAHKRLSWFIAQFLFVYSKCANYYVPEVSDALVVRSCSVLGTQENETIKTRQCSVRGASQMYARLVRTSWILDTSQIDLSDDNPRAIFYISSTWQEMNKVVNVTVSIAT